MSNAPAPGELPARVEATLDAGAATMRGLRLGAAFKSGYGVGQIVESISTVTLNTFLFFYLTNVCGLSGSLTGIALFAALAIDAVADPVIGSISDNLRTRWGQRLPAMAVSLVPLALALGLLFSIPPLSGWALFIRVLITVIALRISMSGFIVPYLGLGAELSPDYDERSNVVAFRVIFGMLGMLIPLQLGFGTFLRGHDGLLDRTAYAHFGWALAASLWVAGMVATCASATRPTHPPAARASAKHVTRRLLGEVLEVFRNPSFRMLFGGVLLFFVGQGLTNALGLDANRFFWSLSVSQIKTVSMSLVGGLALGLPFGFALVGRIEKRTTVLGGITIFAVAQGLPALLKIFGLIPNAITVEFTILIGAAIVAGVAATLVTIAFQSAMADAVDEHEHVFYARREGLYFASLSFAFKAATGIGSMLAGLVLEAVRFPNAEMAKAPARFLHISAPTLRGIGLAYGPVAAIITLASVLFFVRYRIDRATHAAINVELNRRRISSECENAQLEL